MVGAGVQVYSPSQITENVLELVNFEDLPLGGEWRTRRRTITAADVAAFVGLSGDYNPLYVDVEHARGAHFGEPVVPGALVAAVTTGLGAMDVPLPATVGMVGMTWKFIRPVRHGDTLFSRWRLNRKRPVGNPRWGLAVWQIEVENQRGELVATAEMTRLIARRDQPVEARQGKAGRRRRRRGLPEAMTVSDMPPKPMPGPLREPLGRPAMEPAARPAAEAPTWQERRPEPVPEPARPAEPQRPVEPAAEAPAQQDAEPRPARSRRRRSRAADPAPEPAPVPVEPAAEAPPVPEPQRVEEPAAEAPAPEPAPQPRRRGRRRSGAGAEQVPPPPPAEPAVSPMPPAEEQAPVPAAAEPAPEAAEPRPARSRRRRSRAAEPPPSEGPAPEPAAPEQTAPEPAAPGQAAPEQAAERAEPAPAPQREPDPPLPQPAPAIPSPFRPPPGVESQRDAGDAGGLAGVLRRLRGS
jgi:acyl dehydratase